MESATTRADNARAGTDRSAGRSAVRRLSTETKQAFKTTEFWAMVVVIVAILVSAAAIKGGDTAPGTDEFVAKQAWLYVAIVAVGYMISRGLAKSGSREPYDEDRDEHRH
jgi:di/tricarboxylate transporter